MENKEKNVNGTAAKGSKKLFIIGGIIVAFLVISAIVIAIESSGKNKLTIENNTSKKIEKLQLYYASPDTGYKGDVFFEQAVEAGETIQSKTPALNLYGAEARLMTVITFEGEEELTFDNGYFNSKFYGKTSIVFNEDEDGKITMKVDTREGINGSNPNSECDEEWEIDFK